MLDANTPSMEGNGDGYLPDLPVVAHNTEWSVDQVPSETLVNTMPTDSDLSQDAVEEQQLPNTELNSTELGSVEKAVEQFQPASDQVFQEEQPPVPPPVPPQHMEAAEPAEQESQDMAIEAAEPDDTQGQ